jgi:hypothetical protein
MALKKKDPGIRQKEIFAVIIFFVLVLVLISILKRSIFDSYLKIFVEKTISIGLKAKVSVDDLEISLFPPALIANKVYIENINRKTASFKAEVVEVNLAPSPIFLRKVVIPSISLRDVKMSATVKEISDFDLKGISGLEKGKTGFLNFQIDKVVINDFDLELTDLPSRTARLSFAEISAAISRRKAVVKIKGKADLHFGERQFELSDVAGNIRYSDNKVLLENFSITGGRSASFNLGGMIHPRLAVKGELKADAAYLAKLLELPGKPGGKVVAALDVKGTFKAPVFKGQVKSDGIGLGDFKIGGINITLSGNKAGLALTKGKIAMQGSDINFAGDMKFDQTLTSNFNLHFKGLDIRPVGLYLLGIEEFPEGYADCDLNIAVKNARQMLFSGILSGNINQLSSPTESHGSNRSKIYSFRFDRPVKFKSTFEHYDTGALKITSFNVDTENVELGLSGELKDKTGEFKYQFKSTKPDYFFINSKAVGGNVNLSGVLGVKAGRLESDGSIKAIGLKVGDDPLGDISSTYRINQAGFEISGFSFTNGAEKLSGRGRIDSTNSGSVEVEASFSSVEVGHFAKAFLPSGNILRNLTGRFTGEMALKGQIEELSGSVSLLVDDLALYKYPFGALSLQVQTKDGRVEISNLILNKDSIPVLKGTGFYRYRGDSKLNLVAQGINIDALDFLKVKRFFGEASLNFSLNYENLSQRSRLWGALGMFQSLKDKASSELAEMNFDSDLKSISITGTYKKKELDYRATFGLQNKLPFALEIDSLDFNFVPLLSNFMTLNIDKVKGSTSFKANLKGEIKEPGSLSGLIDISTFTIFKEDLTLNINHPIKVRLENGQYSLEPFIIKGTQTDLNVEGKGAFGKDNNFKISGYINLNMLSVFFEEIARAEGKLDLEAILDGPFKDIRLIGNGKLNRGFLAIRDFPNIIQEINSDITFSHKKILLDNITGELGGGRIKGQGSLELGDFDGGIYFDVSVGLTRANSLFPIDYPGEVSGTLMFKGPYYVPTLSGDLYVHKLNYSRPWDWRSRIISFGSKNEPINIAKGPEVYLNINVKAENGAAEIKNNVADVELSGDIRIVGDDKNVGILGNVQVEKGKVYFLDNEFELTGGNIKFIDQRSALALFDVSGKTKVKDVDIFLKLLGNSDKPEVVLESRPPKSETDIVSLLTLGVESTQFTIGGGGAQTSLSQSVMTSILSGPIQENVERTFRKARILDTFQIYPSFSEDTRTTDLKVTIGKKIPYEMEILYSTDANNIGGNQEVKINKGLTDTLSIQGILKEKTDKKIDLGLDLEYKIDF